MRFSFPCLSVIFLLSAIAVVLSHEDLYHDKLVVQHPSTRESDSHVDDESDNASGQQDPNEGNPHQEGQIDYSSTIKHGQDSDSEKNSDKDQENTRTSNAEAHSGQYPRDQDFNEHMQHHPSPQSSSGAANLLTKVYHIPSSSNVASLSSSSHHEPASSSSYSFTGTDPGIGYGSGQESQGRTRYFRPQVPHQPDRVQERRPSRDHDTFHSPDSSSHRDVQFSQRESPSLHAKKFESEAADFNEPFIRSYTTKHWLLSFHTQK